MVYTAMEIKGLTPVRDHYHITGKFRGVAHSGCNLQYQVPDLYPVVILNLLGYDAHLFIKKLKGDIKCIPNTDAKYMSFIREVVMGHSTDKTGKKIVIKH